MTIGFLTCIRDLFACVCSRGVLSLQSNLGRGVEEEGGGGVEEESLADNGHPSI